MPIAGALLVMLTGVLWGTTGTSLALSPYEGSALGFGAARATLTGVVLLALALWRPGPAAFRAAWRADPAARGVRPALVLGAACTAVYQLCFFIATQHTGVVVGTLTAIGSAPLIAGLIGLVTGARPTRTWALATVVGLAGLVLLIGGGGGAQLNPLGVLAGLAAGAGYAAYTWCSRRLLDAGTPPQVVLAVFFAGGAVLVAPLALPDAIRWVANPAGAVTVAYVGLVATVLPYLMWIRGMATTPPALATTLNLTEPLTATVLGAVVLHEAFTPAVAAGAALIAVGLLIALRPTRAPTTPPPGSTEREVSRRPT